VAAAPATRDRVLVILANWTMPDTVTQQSAAAQLFGDDDAWLNEVSYGARGYTGDVTPWVTIAGPDGGLCYTNHRQTMDQAKAAAWAVGFDSALYAKTVLYFPRSTDPNCSGYGGWAYQPGSEVWLNGSMDRRATVHELGHTDGLWHAASFLCVDATGNPVALATSGCSLNEYGDAADAMGASGFAGHFSAVQKSRRGWLAGRSTALLLGGGATLAPFESASAATVAASYTTLTGRKYWLEYRTAVGGDASLPAGLTGGVLVHVEDALLSPKPLLLDMTPDGDFTNAALRPGASWASPDGFYLNVGAVTVAGLPVSVTGAPIDVTAPAPVSGLTSSVKGSNLTLKWANPSDKDFAGVTVRMVAGNVAPASPTSGTELYTGTGSSTTMTVAKNATYSFAVFPRDGVPNWGRGAWVKQAGNKATVGLL
jgi:hypothetical protein